MICAKLRLILLITIIPEIFSEVRIEPNEEELLVTSGAAFVLKCSGDDVVRWEYPESVADNEKTSIKDEKIYTSDNKFMADLHIERVHYMDTGFYYCYNQNKTEEAMIYLYVRDPEKLLVIENLDDLPILMGQQYDDLVIPCRPTFPDVDVKLETPSEVEVPYDPHKGFILKKAMLTDSGDYICLATRNGQASEAYFNVNILPRSETVEKPEIFVEGYEGSHIIVGQNVVMTCRVTVFLGVQVTLDWDLPSHVNTNKINISDLFTEKVMFGGNERRQSYKKLIINDVAIEDKGMYTCRVADHSRNTNQEHYELEVYPVDMKYLNLTMEGNTEILVRASEKEAQWIVHIEAYPIPQIKWFGPYNNSLLSDHEKYTVDNYKEKTKITVHDVSIKDSGIYTLYASNSVKNETLNVTLLVEDKPKVSFIGNSKTYFDINKEEVLDCIISAYPVPSVTWTFVECTDHETFCSPGNSLSPIPMESKQLESVGHVKWRSEIKWYARESGIITCRAENHLGFSEDKLQFKVTDVDNGFAIWGPKKRVLTTDKIQIGCGASIYEYKPQIDWIYKGLVNQEWEVLMNSSIKGFTITNNKTSFSYQSYLDINHVKAEHSGIFKCRVKTIHTGTYMEKEFKLLVQNLSWVTANIDGKKMKITAASDKVVVSKKNLSKRSANPVRENNWILNHEITTKANLNKTVLDSDFYDSILMNRKHSKHHLSRMGPKFYNGTNMNGKSTVIDVGRPATLNCSVYGVPTPVVIWYKDNKIIDGRNTRIKFEKNNSILHIPYTELGDAGLYKCEASNSADKITGHVEIVLKIPVTPSKAVWWILLVFFAIVIAFGTIVYIICKKFQTERKKRKELANMGLYNFYNGQVESLNPNIDIGEQAEYLPYDKKWEFPREKLKLGKQLGFGAFGVVLKGEAIANDGSVTTVAVKMVKKSSDISHVKSLATELKIMSHLGKHLNVVNLLGACTGNVRNRELLVIVEYCRYGNLHKYLIHHRSSFINQIDPRTGTVNFGDTNETTELNYINASSFQTNSAVPSEYSNGQSVQTDMTSLSTPVGEDGYLLNRDAEILATYQGDYKINNVRPICTQDLFCWAFQVAKGMEYLASRKVLHGDLAARNILLAEGNVVKICDFGLAKSMYSRENYKNKKRDVLLPVKWLSIEAIRDGLFSTQSDIWSYGILLWEIFTLGFTPYPGLYGDEFYNKILQGYRMEKPQYSTEDVYNLMLECWKEEPMLRPSFTECGDRLGVMLGEGVRQHYLDLNSPYTEFNEKITSGNDPLSKLVEPTYENTIKTGMPDSIPEGYVCMKPPREDAINEVELRPMITPGCNSFLNPGYQDMKNFKEHKYTNIPQDPLQAENVDDAADDEAGKDEQVEDV